MNKSLYLLLSSVPLIRTTNLWGLQSPVFLIIGTPNLWGLQSLVFIIIGTPNLWEAAKAMFSDNNMCYRCFF
jgi:hypothetical protein